MTEPPVPTYTSDPEAYREACVPHESNEAAKESLARFIGLVRDARAECQIAEAAVVVRIRVKVKGGEGETGTLFHIGDPSHTESMLAYALGRETQLRRDELARLMRGEQR